GPWILRHRPHLREAVSLASWSSLKGPATATMVNATLPQPFTAAAGTGGTARSCRTRPASADRHLLGRRHRLIHGPAMSAAAMLAGEVVSDVTAAMRAWAQVTASRWVNDEPMPGIVEVLLGDANGRVWRFHERAAIFADADLFAASSLCPFHFRMEVYRI